ncbi:MAG TPA: hypothetical protein VKG85_10940 [Actinomycetes bacterium]|nr:hypothetical protein [Actinomycetes bacterium]
MLTPLAPWGIDDRSELLYRAILRHPQRTADQLGRIIGWTASEVNDLARPLLRRRLVRLTESGIYVAPPPSAAIDSLIAAERVRLAQRQHQVLEARTAVSEYTAEHLSGQAERRPPVPMDVVSGTEVPGAIEDLARTTRGDVCSLVRRSRSTKHPYLTQVGRYLIDSGRSMRTVYPIGLMADADQLAAVQLWLNQGEQARVTPEVPTRMIVFGTEAAIIDLTFDQESETDLIVRSPVLVAALRELFERVWTHAVAISHADVDEGSDDRKKLIELLSFGQKDEYVARHLGVSLRTVRRRVADLLAELGAASRFQAGMEAVRRGWA